MKCFKNCLLFVIIFSSYISICFTLQRHQFLPEGARISVMNPKHFKNASFTSYRPSRRSPFLTDFMFETIYPWGNNVTIIFDYYNMRARSEGYQFQIKFCELFKFEWVMQWVREFTDVGKRTCPFPPGVYIGKKLEVPPRNFPVPMNKVDYKAEVTLMKTVSKEELLKLEIMLKVKNDRKF